MKAIYILGPSGSGKSTLCENLQTVATNIFGQKSTLTINLDCANEKQGYDVDVKELISLEDIMEEYEIGPNASLLFSIDFLWKNIDWMIQKLDEQISKRNPSFLLFKNSKTQNFKSEIHQSQTFYLMFDLPGQAQLYLNHDSMKKVIYHLNKHYSLNVCILELFDCSYLYEINNFISLCMMCLSTLTNLELPHLSLLNKIDLMKGRKPGLGMLNDYFAVYSAQQMFNDLIEEGKTNEVAQKIAKIVDQYGQVSFLPCSSYKTQLLLFLLYQIEKVMGTLQLSCACYPNFLNATKEFQGDYAIEKVITGLESQFFKEDQQEMDEMLTKFKKQQE